MENTLTTSVVMATYNGEVYIKEQLDSIRKQTQLPDELIIADDGSTDSTVTIVQNYINEITLLQDGRRFKTYKIKDMKIFFDLASYAKKDVIFFCDQDDVWEPQKIESIINQLDNGHRFIMFQSRFNLCK